MLGSHPLRGCWGLRDASGFGGLWGLGIRVQGFRDFGFGDLGFRVLEGLGRRVGA